MINLVYTVEDMKKLPLRGRRIRGALCSSASSTSLSSRTTIRRAQPTDRLSETPSGSPRISREASRARPTTMWSAASRRFGVARAACSRELALGAIIQAAHSAATGLHTLQIRDEPGDWRFSGPPNRGILPHLADVTADMTTLEAFTAAVEASDAAKYADGFMQGAVADFEKLKSLDLGRYPDAGHPIDPSPKGPLGPLWRKVALG